MKIPKIEIVKKIPFGKLPDLQKLHRLNPLMLMAVGAVSLIVLTILMLAGGTSQQSNDAILSRAQQTMGQVSGMVQNIRRVLEDQQVQELAAIALAKPDKLPNLQQYVSGRIPDLIEIELFGVDLTPLRGADMGPFGYAVLDMLLASAENGLALAQIHGQGETAYMTLAVRIGEEASPAGYLMAKIKPEVLTTVFNSSLSSPGDFALDQDNGQFKSKPIIGLAAPPTLTERLVWLRIPASLFRIGVKQGVAASTSMGILRPLFFILGVFLLALGIMLKIRPYHPPAELSEDPEQAESSSEIASLSDEPVADEPNLPQLQKPAGRDLGEGHGGIDLPDLGFSLEKLHLPFKKALPPVELVESIFRAYDIRGVVDKTLDAEVARQVGQVIGSLTLEQDAGPVVVARDGRDSGPDLVAGMIKGIASTGCYVINIGAVPPIHKADRKSCFM